MHFIYRYTCLCVGLRHVYLFYLYWRVFSMQFIKTCMSSFSQLFYKNTMTAIHTSGKWSSAIAKVCTSVLMNFVVVDDLCFFYLFIQ